PGPCEIVACGFGHLASARHGDDLVALREERRQLAAPIDDLKGAAAGELEGPRVDEVAARIDVVVIGRRMEVEIDLRRVEDPDALLGRDAGSFALDRARELRCAAPIAAPDAEIEIEKSTQDLPPVAIPRPVERDVAAVARDLVGLEEQRPVDVRVEAAGEIGDLRVADRAHLLEALALLDREDVVVMPGELPPIG